MFAFPLIFSTFGSNCFELLLVIIMSKIYYILSRLWLITIFTTVFVSCVDIDDLSDGNSISSFTVTSCLPDVIELGAVEISSDTIYIPILFGIHDLPLTIKAQIEIAADIDKVVGFDSDKEFVFNTLGDEFKFYVMAKSGLTRTYVIALKADTNLGDGNNISKKVKIISVVPESLRSLISKSAQISPQGDTLTMFSVGGVYPISITPEFTITDGASFVDFNNGSVGLKFESAKTTYPVTVKSASGKSRVWTICLNTTPVVTAENIGDYAPSQLNSTNIDVAKCTISSSEVAEPTLVVSNLRNIITIKLPVSDLKGYTYPLGFDFKFEPYPNVELFGIEGESKIIFESLTDVKQFFILDPVEGLSREWSVVLEQTSAEDAKIEGVTFNYTAGEIVTEAKVIDGSVVETKSPCIVLDNSSIEIRPESYEIVIPTSDFKTATILQEPYHNYKSDKSWSVNINNLQLQLSNGGVTDLPSTLSMLSNYVPDSEGKDGSGAKQNDCWKAAQEFNVTSKNGKVEVWTICLSVDLADVEAVQVLGQTPGFTISNSVYIDNSNSKIRLKLSDVEAGALYPLKVNLDMYISQGATASIPLRGEVEFQGVTSSVDFQVTSKKGVVKAWSIVLDYGPQIPYSDLDSWSKRQYNKPQPKEPWQTANTTFTVGTDSEDRVGNGKAAVLKSTSILGKFAAGSVFLGAFDFNTGIGINDPISLTYFGYPFQATAKIKGVEVEINYAGGTGKNYGMSTPFDYGSCVIELLDYNNKESDPEYKNYQYHGLYSDGTPPTTAGRENNATSVVKGAMYFANGSGEQHNGVDIQKVGKGVWEKVFIPFNYSGDIVPEYTHIHIVFSGSARGDFFCGYKGTILKVDNVKLVYE